MHKIKKLRALYLDNFFMKFDNFFNFVHVLGSFEANQIKVVFSSFCVICFGGFVFLLVITKICQV